MAHRHYIIIIEKAGKRYAAFEYGSDDNSFGAIFEETSETSMTEIVDGFLECAGGK